MSALAAACASRPFSNGTEGDAWMSKWCAYCVHDHRMHTDEGGGCEVLVHAFFPEDYPWPECWLPEPDDGAFCLPSRLVCRQFEPCTKGGCTGDPGAEDRAVRVAEVERYWQERER